MTQVPAEIEDAILCELVGDKESLLLCSLVSPVFRGIAQRLLFSTISLRNKEWAAVNAFFVEHSRLAVCVKKVSFSGAPFARKPSIPYAETTGVSIIVRGGTPYSDDDCDYLEQPALPQLYLDSSFWSSFTSVFPRASSIILSCITFTPSSTLRAHERRTAGTPGRTVSSLQHISLYDCSLDPSYLHLGHPFFPPLPHLLSLDVHRVTFDDLHTSVPFREDTDYWETLRDTLTSDGYPALSTDLSSLKRIDYSAEVGMPEWVFYSCPATPLTPLTRLEIDRIYGHYLVTISSALRAVASTLRFLYIGIADTYLGHAYEALTFPPINVFATAFPALRCFRMAVHHCPPAEFLPPTLNLCALNKFVTEMAGQLPRNIQHVGYVCYAHFGRSCAAIPPLSSVAWPTLSAIHSLAGAGQIDILVVTSRSSPADVDRAAIRKKFDGLSVTVDIVEIEDVLPHSVPKYSCKDC